LPRFKQKRHRQKNFAGHVDLAKSHSTMAERCVRPMTVAVDWRNVRKGDQS
jgi:hypothetical protein